MLVLKIIFYSILGLLGISIMIMGIITAGLILYGIILGINESIKGKDKDND